MSELHYIVFILKKKKINQLPDPTQVKCLYLFWSKQDSTLRFPKMGNSAKVCNSERNLTKANQALLASATLWTVSKAYHCSFMLACPCHVGYIWVQHFGGFKMIFPITKSVFIIERLTADGAW